MHVDPLNRAAALPGTEHCTVNELDRDVREICVRTHVGRIIAAEFQIHGHDATGCCFADAQPAFRGAGEGNEVDLGKGDDLLEHVERAAVDELEQVCRETGLREEGEEAFADEGCLRGWPEQNGVSC